MVLNQSFNPGKRAAQSSNYHNMLMISVCKHLITALYFYYACAMFANIASLAVVWLFGELRHDSCLLCPISYRFLLRSQVSSLYDVWFSHIASQLAYLSNDRSC